MNSQKILTKTDEEIFEIAKQLRIAYGLKKTIRYAGARDFTVHGESVAEHVFALLFLAQYFLPLEDPEGTLSKEKVYETLLFHDFGEIVHGDVPYHYKTASHAIQEAKDAETVFASLPKLVGEPGRARWKEYEDHATPEARFVYALDKIEPVFELLDPVNEKSLRRTKFTYEAHIGKKREATKDFPVMRRFMEVLGNRMKARGIFWEEQ